MAERVWMNRTRRANRLEPVAAPIGRHFRQNNGENEWLKIIEPSHDRPQVRFGILASPDPGALPGTGNFAWRRSRHLTLPTGLDPPFPNII
jgi:hypothetical protein